MTVAEIADVRRRDPLWKPFFKDTDQKREFYNVIIDKTEVLVKDQNRLVAPKVLRARVLQ